MKTKRTPSNIPPAPIDYEKPRSRRLQLLIRPELYERILAEAQKENRSFNNKVEAILEAHFGN